MDPYFFEFVVVSSPEYLLAKQEEEKDAVGTPPYEMAAPLTKSKNRTMWDIPDPHAPKGK